ncbi:MAG: hypothetical protein ACI8UZ_002955, partial [Akkermansiaceae bacterium]
FGIGSGLGDDSLIWESEIAGGENGRLCILDVHIGHFGEVSDTAGDGDVAFILDRAGLGAIAHAVVAGRGVGAEGDEKNVQILVRQMTAELGELTVIADENADSAGIGLKDFDLVAADHAPVIFFTGSDVDFILGLVGAIAAAEEDDVIKPLLMVVWHATGDDIDVVLDRFLDEEFQDFVGMVGETTNRGGGSQVIIGGHERRHTYRSPR